MARAKKKTTKKKVAKKKTPAKKAAAAKPEAKPTTKAIDTFMRGKFGKVASKKVSLQGKLIQFEDGVPTPWWNLNYILSKNPLVAFKYGRMGELFADEGAGKTTASLQIAKFYSEVTGEPVGYVDSEQRLDTKYALDVGVKEESFLLRQPDSGEEAFEELKDMVKSGFRFIINDSIAGNVPLAILNGSAEDSHMAVHARLCGRQLSVLRSLVNKHKCFILFINQTRFAIGKMGDPTITTGGKEIKFWFSYRMQMFQPRTLKIEGGEGNLEDLETTKETGKFINIKTIKNGFNSPYQQTRLKLGYGLGFDDEYSRLRFYHDIGALKLADSGKSLKIEVGGDTKEYKQVPSFQKKFEASASFQKKIKKKLHAMNNSSKKEGDEPDVVDWSNCQLPGWESEIEL